MRKLWTEMTVRNYVYRANEKLGHLKNNIASQKWKIVRKGRWKKNVSLLIFLM